MPRARLFLLLDILAAYWVSWESWPWFEARPNPQLLCEFVNCLKYLSRSLMNQSKKKSQSKNVWKILTFQVFITTTILSGLLTSSRAEAIGKTLFPSLLLWWRLPPLLLTLSTVVVLPAWSFYFTLLCNANSRLLIYVFSKVFYIKFIDFQSHGNLLQYFKNFPRSFCSVY